MRLFIAIELEKNIRVYIESIQSQFKGLGQFSFPKQENFHITLKFFLELQDPSVVKRDLNNVKFEPFELK
ncbi:MAG: RNA 2',3'-cyclic phosphodiesterase, partial [Nanoarchaeota archaeon]|nr:RNA 2',3'-cyclic phosphodiesterase [Nanoarchaeota archaeon]